MPDQDVPAFDVPAFDVIVAGAGPVGLTLAIDLGRRGVRCLLIERSPTTLPYPKMDRSNARTMEFYRRIGIAERVRALGYPADNPMDVFLTTRLCDPPIAVLKYPSVAERRKQIAESPNGAWLLEPYQLVSQNKLEPLLKEVAEATPNVTVRYGCGLEDFTQDDDGVTVQARTAAGAPEELRASYLVGCDGGASTVRKKAGIKLEGQGRIRKLVQVIFRSDDLYQKIVTGKGRHYNFVDANSSTLIAQGCRTEFTLHTSLPADTDFRPVIQDLVGFPCSFEITHVIQWHHNLLLAEHYRDRRVFLAGDAVHLVIPSGGLGMNTGVGDAFDLAWKLAGTIHGWGGPELLDGYERERRPIGRRNVDAAGWAAAGVPIWRALVTPDAYDDTPAGAAVRARLVASFDVEHRRMHGMVGAEAGYSYAGSPLIADEPRGRMGDQPLRAQGAARRAHPAYVAGRRNGAAGHPGRRLHLARSHGPRRHRGARGGLPRPRRAARRHSPRRAAGARRLRRQRLPAAAGPAHRLARRRSAERSCRAWRRSPRAGSATETG